MTTLVAPSSKRGWLLLGAVLALVAGVLWAALPRRADAERQTPSASPPQSADAQAPAETAEGWSLPPREPTMDDVQRWYWLQDDGNQLLLRAQSRDHRKLDADAFRRAFLGATVEYLELAGEARARFERAVELALAEIAAARQVLPGPAEEPRASFSPEDAAVHAAAWDRFRAAQRAALQGVLDTLDERPRHRLFREHAWPWLLRLDYGIRAATRRNGPGSPAAR